MFKINYKNTRATSIFFIENECKTPYGCLIFIFYPKYWRLSGVLVYFFIVNFEEVNAGWVELWFNM